MIFRLPAHEVLQRLEDRSVKAKIFEQRYLGIKVSIAGGFSNVLDKKVDQQLSEDKLEVDPPKVRSAPDIQHESALRLGLGLELQLCMGGYGRFEIRKHGDEDRAAKPFELPIANHAAIL